MELSSSEVTFLSPSCSISPSILIRAREQRGLPNLAGVEGHTRVGHAQQTDRHCSARVSVCACLYVCVSDLVEAGDIHASVCARANVCVCVLVEADEKGVTLSKRVKRVVRVSSATL